MVTLGINAAFHDPAAALVHDGRLIAAAEEERFTRIKHGKRPVPFTAYELPFHAIDYCLGQAGVSLDQVDRFAYSFDPSLLGDADGDRWQPLFSSYVSQAPDFLVDGAPHHLKARLKADRAQVAARWRFVPHHLAHASSAFHASPFSDAAVMTLDGRGERTTTSYGIGADASLRLFEEVRLPNSLGLLYEEVTEHLGFLRSCDEYKVMALASFGSPTELKRLREVIQLTGRGQYEIGRLDLAGWFGPARAKGGPIERRHLDLACSMQKVLEETALELASWLRRETKLERLCLAGGVALNCVMNARLRDEGPFREIWVQPAAGDAGTAIGAALWIDAADPDGKRSRSPMHHALLGPAFSDEEIEDLLKRAKLPYRRLVNVAEEAAELLVKGRIIGWFQGRMEFGPRALGARSILASPIDPAMQDRLNEIKEREDFRPVAPVVLEEEAADWFDGGRESPFMLFVFNVRPQRAAAIPAVRHIDGTARIQTIRRGQQPGYYDLIRAFFRKTGVPVLVNTSFNTRGEPIVCTPRDALECFSSSPLDALVIGSFLLEKDKTTLTSAP